MTAVPARAVIMAGGRGTRLEPYTVTFPKPLMPLGDMPILELLIRRLKRVGVKRIDLAVGHLSYLIETYFGDGQKLGVTIEYSREQEPLGTAGPLSLIEDLNQPFLVMNGDLLTDLDFTALAASHEKAAAIASIGLYRRSVRSDFGVIERDVNGAVSSYLEKPTTDFLVSMGVYLFDPAVMGLIPPARFDIPELINALLAAKHPINAYEHQGYWLDIGRPDDYAQAQRDVDIIRHRLLGEDPPAPQDIRVAHA